MTKKPQIFKCFSKQTPARSTAIEGPVDFETAISAIQYGKFHYWILLTAIPSALVVQFESSLTAFIGPVAQCDLNLSLEDKGVLNSMPFAGMLLSGFLWGFLLDLFGRKKILFIGFFIETALTIGSGLSQSFVILAIMKLLGGCITGGLYISMITYISEFHSKKHRSRIQMYIGSLFGMANIIIPLISSFFLPLPFYVTFWGFELHAWNLMIICTSLAGLIAGISFIFLPETPKFLMSQGDNEKALTIFRKCYAMNTGDDISNFPVLKLIEEVAEVDECKNKRSIKDSLAQGWKQMAPLFGRSCGPKLVLLCIVQSLQGSIINSYRLWLPQIFQATHELEASNNGKTETLCEIIKTLKPATDDEACSVNVTNNFSVYSNLIIVAAGGIVGYALAGTLINWLGKKPLLLILGTTSCVLMMCLYVSKNTETTLLFSAVLLACCGVFFDIILTIAVVLFPTTLRAMALSIIMLSSRALTIAGNIVFPYLLQAGCGPPFFTFGGILSVSVFLTLLLPNTDNKNLE